MTRCDPTGHESGDPSDWVARWAPLAPTDRPVLDLACGRGRHTRWLLPRGATVVAVDRDVSGLDDLRGDPALTIVEHDLERGDPFPFAARSFGGVVVTNYLHRPLVPAIVAAVAPGGVLVYETFAVGHERHGRPSNPDFLLRPGELREAVAGELEVLAFEEFERSAPRAAVLQRIAARRPA